MPTPDTIRAKRHRDRRRLGSLCPGRGHKKPGYEVDDKVSIGRAVSALLSDLVLEEA